MQDQTVEGSATASGGAGAHTRWRAMAERGGSLEFWFS
jgi:hypothetical protein